MRHFLHFFDFDARSKKHPCTRPCTHFQDARIALAVTAGAFAALALARTRLSGAIMSTQENISSASWLLAYASRVVGHSVRKFKAFALLNLNILFRPSWIDANVILDDGPAGLLHAGRYYLKAFALAFSIWAIASRFATPMEPDRNGPADDRRFLDRCGLAVSNKASSIAWPAFSPHVPTLPNWPDHVPPCGP